MFSRLDYFFMLNSDRHRVIDCDIGVRDISDHAGVYLTLHLDIKRKATLWRFNSGLLNETQFCKSVENEFKNYMNDNDNGDISPSVLWDAAKAVLRGKFLMWSPIKKKGKERQIEEAVMKLRRLEDEYMKNNNEDTLTQLLLRRQALNQLYENQMENKDRFIKQT